MNRHLIEKVIPPDLGQLNGAQLRKVVLDLVEAIVDAIEGEGREPDDWEGPDLARALDCLRQGWDTAALTFARRSLAELEDQGLRAEETNNDPPPTVRVLRMGVQQLRM